MKMRFLSSALAFLAADYSAHHFFKVEVNLK